MKASSSHPPMAKNHTSSVCEKIYEAMRHISPCPQSSKPPAAASSSPSPYHHQKTAKNNESISSEVPIIFNASVSPAPIKERTPGQGSKSGLKNEQVKPRVEPRMDSVPTGVAVPEKAKTVVEIASAKTVLDGQVKPNIGRVPSAKTSGDNDFSNYIHQAKAKIRTTSSVGGGEGKSVARLDSWEVKVSDYIKRTKMKIRSMSGVGVGRSVSTK